MILTKSMEINDVRERRGQRGPGERNLRWAWWEIGVSLASGLVLGLWSFGGPMPVPEWIGGYDALPRRLLRLAHIAAIALPLLNLHFVPAVRRSWLSDSARQWACGFLLLGTVGLPTLLVLAALFPVLVLVLAIPACCIVAAVFLLAWGLSFRKEVVQ